MIIEDYGQCKIFYTPWSPPVIDEEGNHQPPIEPPYKMSCDVKCFNLTKEELDLDLHLAIAPGAWTADNTDPTPHYDIRLKNYSIYSGNYQFIYNLFKVLLKFRNGSLPENYDFKKENAECLV